MCCSVSARSYWLHPEVFASDFLHNHSNEPDPEKRFSVCASLLKTLDLFSLGRDTLACSFNWDLVVSTCAGLRCCPEWDASGSPALMGGRSVFRLSGNSGDVSRSLAVGLWKEHVRTLHTLSGYLCLHSNDLLSKTLEELWKFTAQNERQDVNVGLLFLLQLQKYVW